MSNIFDYARETFGAASVPSSAQQVKQNTLFQSWENVIGECLPDLDLLYVFATDGDRDYARINWINPGTFTPSENGTLTFTTNVGFQGNGTTGYLNPAFTPSTNAVRYQQNDASIFCYINNDVGNSNYFDFGCNGGVTDPSTFLNTRTAGNVHNQRINSTVAESKGSGVSSTGLFQLQRTGSTTSKIFKNGSQVGTNLTSSSNGVPNRQLLILANNNNNVVQSFSARQMGCFGLGSSLAGKEVSIYNAWNTYFTSL